MRVVPEESYGAALQYFTGSKAHNIVVRRMAQERGLKINEYGVFRGDRRVAGDTEESVYAAVGLPWIPPELREDRGEIEAARAGKLPKLVELSDLRGDLHVHSTASDGHDTIEEMALAAKHAGWSTSPSPSTRKRLTVAHGLDLGAADASRWQKSTGSTRSVRDHACSQGIEVDILDDGTLDLPDARTGRAGYRRGCGAQQVRPAAR